MSEGSNPKGIGAKPPAAQASRKKTWRTHEPYLPASICRYFSLQVLFSVERRHFYSSTQSLTFLSRGKCYAKISKTATSIASCSMCHIPSSFLCVKLWSIMVVVELLAWHWSVAFHRLFVHLCLINPTGEIKFLGWVWVNLLDTQGHSNQSHLLRHLSM